MNRWALTIAAGLAKLPSFQNTGQLVQQAHRILGGVVVAPRSVWDWIRSRVGALPLVIQVRFDRAIGVEERFHVDHQVLLHGQAADGL